MLDLKKFKKISSDSTHSIFEHPDGHTIRVVHQTLDKDLHQELKGLPTAKKMSEGGEVKPDPKKPKPPKEELKKDPYLGTSDQRDRASEISKGFRAAMGFAEGTPEGSVEDEIRARFAGFKMPGLEGAAQEMPGSAPQSSAVMRMEPGLGGPSAPPSSSQLSMPPDTVPLPTNVDLQVQQPQQGSGDPFGIGAYQQAMGQGIAEQKQGLAQEAQGLGQQGQAEAQAAQATQENLQNLETDYHSHAQVLDTERQGLMQDLQNKHIDPSRLVGKQDTMQKVSTAIGLILGGIGGGLTGQENPALKYLSQQIDNDIQAQKAELGKSESLLNANLRQFGNLHDATQMTRAMQMDMAGLRLKQAAAQAQDPLAKARALQAAGKLDMDSAAITSQLAMKKTMLGGMQSGRVSPEAVVNLAVPQEQRKEAVEELKTAQEMSKLRENTLQAFDKVNAMSLGGALSPSQKAALVGPIIADISKRTAGRFTEQDAKLLESLFPKSGSVKTEARQVMRSQLNKLFTDRMNFPILKLYGIAPPTIDFKPRNK